VVKITSLVVNGVFCSTKQITFGAKKNKTEIMLKQIIRTETKDCIYYEAIFNWGSLYAYSIKDLLNELQRFNLNYSLN
jgi:hypothetical protein